MRRLARLCGTLVLLQLVGCSRKSRDDSPQVAPDPVASASVSASAKPLPVAAPFSAKDPPTVLAKGDDVAWIDVDGRVGHTTDGGAHWTWTKLPGTYASRSIVLARGDGSAWATTVGADGTTTKHFRFDDKTWIDVTPPTPPTAEGLDLVQPYDRDVAFTAHGDSSKMDGRTLLTTHDGGRTWKSETMKIGAPTMGARFFSLDRDRTWALVELEHGISSMPGILYFTDDGAARGWMTVVPPPPSSGELSFLDDKRGFLLASTTTTSPPNLWRTDDGGLSWKKTFDEGDAISAMPIFDGDDAVLVADDLHFTSDGGKTWSKGAPRPEGVMGQHGHDVLRVSDGAIAGSHAGGAFGAAQHYALLVGDPISVDAPTYATAWVVIETKAGTYGVAFTHDGARTWGSVAPP